MKNRDTQRARLYLADDVLRPLAAKFDSLDDVERFVRRMWKSKRLAADYPRAHRLGSPRVKRGRANCSATGGVWTISMPTWAWREDVTIHEVAHTITQRQWGTDVAGHGWQFCSVYLRLTLLFMGRYAHDNLKLSFKAHRVRFRPPRKARVISAEERSAMIARLSAARAKAVDMPASAA